MSQMFHPQLNVLGPVGAILLATALSSASPAMAGSLQAPEGLFKDLNDEILGDAITISGTQLFVDDDLISQLTGATRNLNQPVKHPDNPLVVRDKPWEGTFGFSSVMYDQDEGFFKMWYGSWLNKKHFICYATSPDGLAWRKHLTTSWYGKEHNNIVYEGHPEFNCVGVFKDPNDPDGERRYKMVYSDYPDGTAKTASSSAAYSPDGIYWLPYPENPLIPFSDSHCCPFWDPRRGRYVTYLRYGPPNVRSIAMTESEDFVHWSPKITLFQQGSAKMDLPLSTKLYQMEAMPYGDYYFGFITTYHGETIQPIPEENQSWADKSDVQLTYSRDGRVWYRVGKNGALSTDELAADRDWKAFSRQSTFLPWGKHGQDWDWGALYVLQAPMVYNDEIRIYYAGRTNRHWAKYHGDTDTKSGIGLATLRRDGFVSVDAKGKGSLTTKTLLFIGDQIEVNADATGGSILVEALDADGNVIEGFSAQDCEPLTSDSVRHVLKWKGNSDCHLIQAMPIKLRFKLDRARLFSFTPRVRHKHYVPSYD